MRVLVTGATGFVGSEMVRRLLAEGHQVAVLTRDVACARGRLPAECDIFRWDPLASRPPAETLTGIEGIIHLAGESVARRWSRARKGLIRDSRILGTRNLMRAVYRAHPGPKVFVSASGIDYYGDRGDELLTEDSSAGKGFLAEVCRDWEREVAEGAGSAVRTVMVRTGLVLGKEGGALSRMLPVFRAGLGGPIGSGRQWVSWIHRHDLVSLYLFALRNGSLAGPVNGVAPNAVINRDFAKTLGRALRRPTVMRAPSFAVKLALGEMGALLLGSRRVWPQKALADGFQFRFPDLRAALADIVGGR